MQDPDLKKKVPAQKGNNEMKANVQIIFIVNLFFALFVFSNSIGSELGNDIKIEMTYLPSSKTINLSITNTGKDATFVYSPDLKPKDYIYIPAFLSVKLKNKENKILSNVWGADDGFISSNIFKSSLIKQPISPIMLSPKESINLKINFGYLIGGYEKYVPELSETKYIKLRFMVPLDENLSNNKIYTTGWLLYNN